MESCLILYDQNILLGKQLTVRQFGLKTALCYNQYMLKALQNCACMLSTESAHGHGGPLQIQIPDCIGLAREWNLAGQEMGYPHIDLNGRHTEGKVSSN